MKQETNRQRKAKIEQFSNFDDEIADFEFTKK